VINASLAEPQIAFRLIKDRKIIFDLPATENELVRIRSILGKNITDEMIEVFYGGVNLKMSGYIGKPSIARSSKSMQFLFVNNRPVKSAVLSYAVKQAYHSLMPKEKNPVFVVKFVLQPSMVDVNVHPRKTEIKFTDEREIFRILTSACKASLENSILVPKIGSSEPLNFYQDRKPEGITQLNFNQSEENQSGADANAELFSMKNEAGQTKSFDTFLSDQLDVIGQLNNAFILCRRANDLVIVDQHAAHERIRFEQLKHESTLKEKSIQNLLTPVNIELAQNDIAVLNDQKEHFESLGIQISHFGGNTFSIEAVPSFLVKHDLEKIILGVIDDLKNNSVKGDFNQKHEKVLAYLACRSAVKFGDPLTKEEQIALIEQLNKVESRFSCPHGRPVMMVMEESELWSRFGRKYLAMGDEEKFKGINC